MEPEFVDGDRATRLKMLALVGVVILLILLDQLTFPGAALRVTDPMQALKKSVDRLLIAALTSLPFCAGISIYCLRLAIKVKRSGRWPPPGIRVPIRLQVVRGRRAKRTAILLFFLAAVMILPAAALIYAWHLSSQLAREPWLTRNPALTALLTADYRPVSKVDSIPAAVRAALFSLMKDDPRLANPGERFNSTDVVDRRFPMRRLIVAGGLPTSWLVCYEHGGRGYVRHLVIFAVQGDKTELRFSGLVGVEVTSLRDLRKAVRDGHVTDNTRDADGYY
jgi:hypothetical protein